jgi:hypothetical protein
MFDSDVRCPPFSKEPASNLAMLLIVAATSASS